MVRLSRRAAVSVVVPFGGAVEELAPLVDSLAALRLSAEDEVLIVDNTADGLGADPLPAPLRYVPARGQRSSYFARNVGTEAGSADWILFLDADCRPPAALIDAYFEPAPAEECGILAGGVQGLPGQAGAIPAWARSRGHVGERVHLDAAPLPAGITANLMVRRAAWQEVGGFQEGVRSGADLEFCWRAQSAGWTFEHRPDARVDHVHVESVRSLLAKARRYGGGQTWVDRRFPGWSPPARLRRELPRAVAGAIVFALSGQFERARFKLIDGAWYGALRWGRLSQDNFAPGPAPAGNSPAARVEASYPVRGADPAAGAVEAVMRPSNPDMSVRRAVAIHYREDDPPARRLSRSLWLALRHPWRCGRFARAHGTAALFREAPAAARLLQLDGPPEVGADPEARLRADRLAQLCGW